VAGRNGQRESLNGARCQRRVAIASGAKPTSVIEILRGQQPRYFCSALFVWQQIVGPSEQHEELVRALRG